VRTGVTPAETHADTPAESPVDTPVDTPADMPANTPASFWGVRKVRRCRLPPCSCGVCSVSL